MNSYPRVKNVVPLKQKILSVTFVNGVTKLYDCKPLLTKSPFMALSTDAIFDSIKLDQGGYGISWSNEIDLSEAELWLHGTPTDMQGDDLNTLCAG